MDPPYGHHHHRHQQHGGGEEDRDSFSRPPPRNNFSDAPPPPNPYQPHPLDPYAPHHPPAPAPPYGSESQFDPYAPHPPAPAPYRSEPYFEAPPPPAPYRSGNQFDPYAPPPPGPSPPYRSEPYYESRSPPSQFGQVSHVGHHNPNETNPPEHNRYGGYPPSSNSALESHGGVEHVSHNSSHKLHAPSVFHHRPEANRLPDNLAGLAGRQTVKVYSKAEPDYYLTIRDGKVILAPSDPSDEAQHWYKDEKYSTRVKDAEGNPCFALVNKATGEAMKHSVGASHPVHLIRYDPDRLDESVLWTESKDLGDGYRTIRMINNISLHVDAFHGDSKSGGVRDGTPIVLWDWNKGDNQRWKIFPFSRKARARDSAFSHVTSAIPV
ncbi:unnamed protein product [Cochlearia groenlandica]